LKVSLEYAMTVSPSPRAVVERLLELVATGPSEQMADLFAENAVFEAPYAPPGVPAVEHGRETFRAHLRQGAEIQRFHGIEDVRIYETSDPEVVIAEYLVRATITGSGKQFDSRLVLVARVRDGLIVSSRNYANPLDAAVAFGMADQLLAAATVNPAG